MGRDEMDGRSPEGAAKRGLWRLMLKLPAVRGEMQALGRSEALASLCEAYEDASTMLERLLHARGDDQQTMIEEYRTICTEIETDVIQYCLLRGKRVPK